MFRIRNKSKTLASGAKAALVLLITASFLAMPVSFASAEDDPEEIAFIDGLPCKADEVLVKYSETESIGEIACSLSSVSSEIQDTLPEDIVIADVPDGQTVESFIEELSEAPGVEYAQPNYIYKLDTTSVSDTYSLNGVQWYLGKIGVYDAWDTTMGSAYIKVAVLDTGIDLDHEDLVGQIYAQTGRCGRRRQRS